ncbi:MAG: hypothetical protein JNM60_10525 [Candidatus Competibacteraceae bacterium]|nr:hypothetical protein [Candidatus Competibacteraceae bacterium]
MSTATALRPQPYRSGDLPDSIRVAFCSDSGERLDGHFGSCRQFMIYQLCAREARLIELREAPPPLGPLKGEDNILRRVTLISDCHLLYVLSIGGPAAARVINRGVHLLKPDGGSLQTQLDALRQMLERGPPPWLARIVSAPITSYFEGSD